MQKIHIFNNLILSVSTRLLICLCMGYAAHIVLRSGRNLFLFSCLYFIVFEALDPVTLFVENMEVRKKTFVCLMGVVFLLPGNCGPSIHQCLSE